MAQAAVTMDVRDAGSGTSIVDITDAGTTSVDGEVSGLIFALLSVSSPVTTPW